MKAFEVIDHTADLGIIAYGETLSQAFTNTAYGMFSQITDLKGIKPKQEVVIEVSAEDLESLLVVWLNELLYNYEVDNFIFKEFEIESITDYQLKASARGEKIDKSSAKILREIKAVTYHMLKVEHNKEWKVQVLFDI